MIRKPARSSQHERVISPWITLVANEITDDSGSQTFHCIRQADYVTALCVTAEGKIPLVRQYRPAVDAITLELPGGLLEAGEASDPERAAARELEEESGYRVIGPMTSLGTLFPDTGRLENRLHCYFSANIVPVPGWHPEPNTERALVSVEELFRLVIDGELKHALHLAAIAAAIVRGLLSPYIGSSLPTGKTHS